MDALSRLLILHPVDTALDLRCRFRAPWLEQRPERVDGAAPYHLVVDGQVQIQVDGHSVIDLYPGDLVMLPRGSGHSLRAGTPQVASSAYRLATSSPVPIKHNDGDGELADILCGQFKFGAAARTILMDALPDVVLLRASSEPRPSALRTLVTLLRDETDDVRPGSHAVIAHLAGALFSLMMREWLEQPSAQALDGLLGLLAQPRLRPALQSMLDDPRRAWSLESLAEKCHTSRATFARLFRTATGETPGDILLRTRMAHAALSLAQDDRSLADIAESIGYSSEAAFSRAFKKTFGTPPGQFRRES